MQRHLKAGWGLGVAEGAVECQGSPPLAAPRPVLTRVALFKEHGFWNKALGLSPISTTWELCGLEQSI